MIRGKNKINVDYSAPDIFKYYCKITGNPHKLTQKDFTTITKDFYNRISTMLIYNSFEYSLPKRLGNLRVVKYKNKLKLTPDGNLDKRNLKVDWKKTRQLWKELYPGVSDEEIKLIPDKKKIYFENKHTDGYIFKWHWDRSTACATNYIAYHFKTTRHNNRELAKAVKSDEPTIDFYTYDNK